MGLYLILQHLDRPGTSVRILILDFSSAFNTIILDTLQNKLKQLSSPPSSVSESQTSLSVFVTNHATPTSYIIRQNGFHFPQLDEVKANCSLYLKYGYFSYENAWIRNSRPLKAVKPCEACFIMDGCALFDIFWTVEPKHPPTAMIMLAISGQFLI